MKGKIAHLKTTMKDGTLHCKLRFEGTITIDELNRIQQSMHDLRTEDEKFYINRQGRELTMTLDPVKIKETVAHE